MNWISGGKEPATKDDLMILQKTVVACAIASNLIVVQAIKNENFSVETTSAFIDASRSIISGVMTNLDL